MEGCWCMDSEQMEDRGCQAYVWTGERGEIVRGDILTKGSFGTVMVITGISITRNRISCNGIAITIHQFGNNT